MTAAAISAVFSDYKLVKTRSVIALVFEVPIEKQAEVFAVLGFPMPGEEINCGIARLVPQTVARDLEQQSRTPSLNQNNNSASGVGNPEEHPAAAPSIPGATPPGGGVSHSTAGSIPATGATKDRRPWETLSPQQQAGILCADKGFQKWVSQEFGGAANEKGAAVWLRLELGIESRRDLANQPYLVRKLGGIRAEFLEWAGRVPGAVR